MTPPKNRSLPFFALLGLGVIGCLGDGTELQGTTEQAVDAPTGLTATALSPQRISLSWNAVAGASSYVILKGKGPGTETNLTSSSPPTSTTYLDDNTNNEPGTTYCYQVRVVVGSAASPPSTPEACATTASKPRAPSGLQAVVVSSTSVNLSWNSVPGATRYALYRSTDGVNFASFGSVAAPTLSFLVEGLTPGTTYSFEVASVVPIDVFSDRSAPVTAATLNGGLEAYYRFDEKTGTTALDSAQFKRDGVLQGGAVLTTTDAAPLKDSEDHNPSSLSLPTSTSNVSAAGAVSFSGSGDSSISLWVKLPAALSGPVSIIGRQGADCGPITWVLGQDPTNGLTFTASTITTFGRALPVGIWTQLGVAQHGSTLALYVNGALVRSSTTFSASTTFVPSMQIGDVGGCGNAGPLLVDEVKVFSRTLSAAEMASFGTAPPAPTNLVVTETHSTFIKFSWTPVPNADHYLVYKGSAPGNEAFFTSNGTASFVADHLTPNQTTTWQVVTISTGGFLLSGRSTELVAVTAGPPAAPGGLTATLDACCSPQRVNLTWNAVPGATQYGLLQSTNGGPFVSIGSTLPPTTSFQVAGLAAGTTYQFEVTTRDDGGTLGPPSAPVSATTPTSTP